MKIVQNTKCDKTVNRFVKKVAYWTRITKTNTSCQCLFPVFIFTRLNVLYEFVIKSGILQKTRYEASPLSTIFAGSGDTILATPVYAKLNSAATPLSLS